MTPTKITLPESDIPTHFYNIVADLRTGPTPPLQPGTRERIYDLSAYDSFLSGRMTKGA